MLTSRYDDPGIETDADLVARARRGDDVAFGQLVRRHQSGVHRAARAVLGCASDADDVVQEAWLHAYVRLAQFKETASFKTWVHAIVRNRAIDHHRRARRRRSYTVAYGAHFPAHVEMRSDVRTPEELMLDGEREERLAAAMATLPERLRVTLTLWHSGDYSYEQMARIAGVRMGTIKSRVWEARQHVTKGFFSASRRASG